MLKPDDCVIDMSESLQAAAVPMTFISKVKNAFLDSLYFLLDGLVHLAFSDYEPLPTIDRNRESSRVDPKDAVSDDIQVRLLWAHLTQTAFAGDPHTSDAEQSSPLERGYPTKND